MQHESLDRHRAKLPRAGHQPVDDRLHRRLAGGEALVPNDLDRVWIAGWRSLLTTRLALGCEQRDVGRREILGEIADAPRELARCLADAAALHQRDTHARVRIAQQRQVFHAACRCDQPELHAGAGEQRLIPSAIS